MTVEELIRHQTAVIADETAAKSISDLMLDIGRRLDQSLVNIKASTSEEEFRIYRRAVGAILGEILLGVLNPLYARHPSLKPPELN